MELTFLWKRAPHHSQASREFSIDLLSSSQMYRRDRLVCKLSVKLDGLRHTVLP